MSGTPTAGTRGLRDKGLKPLVPSVPHATAYRYILIYNLTARADYIHLNAGTDVLGYLFFYFALTST